MTRIAGAAACALTLLGVRSPALNAQDYSWPRQITVTQGTIILYQPQPESLVGNQLTARGAFALKPTGRVDPIFGAMWLTATVDVDRDSGQVWIHDLKVTRARWADATADQLGRFTEIVETDFPDAGFHITLERLTASLAAAGLAASSMRAVTGNITAAPSAARRRTRMATVMEWLPGSAASACYLTGMADHRDAGPVMPPCPVERCALYRLVG